MAFALMEEMLVTRSSGKLSKSVIPRGRAAKSKNASIAGWSIRL